MAGMTPAGFELKRLPEIISESKQRAVPIFQDLLTNPNDVVDTSDSSTIGRLVNLQAPSIADLWEALQGVYSAFDPNSAEGIALDNLAELVGLVRQGQTKSSVQLVLTLDAATTVPAGNIVRASDTGSEWQTTNPLSANIANYATGISLTCTAPVGPQDFTITYRVGTSTSSITYSALGGETSREVLEELKFIIDSVHNVTLKTSLVGSVLAVETVNPLQQIVFTITSNIQMTQMKLVTTATSVEFGPIAQEPGTIVNISTPILGWREVTNPSSSVLGRDVESDEQLRDRLLTSRSQRSNNTWDSLYSGLLSIEGVTSVNLEENATDTAVGTLPPYSYTAVVLGGSDQEIGQVVWRNKPLGIAPQGNTAITVQDIRGDSKTVRFSRPSEITIYIEMSVVTDSNLFPGDGIDQIKQSILNYSATNFGIGDDVIYSKLFTPINQIRGHYVDSLKIGTTPSPIGTSNILINFDEIASFSAANIIVNTV